MPRYRLREEEEEQPLLVELDDVGFDNINISVNGYVIAYFGDDGVLYLVDSAGEIPGLASDKDGYIQVRKD